MSFICNGEGGGSHIEIVYWKREGQYDLVGINETTWGMCCDQSEVKFLQFYDNTWRETTSEVFPKIICYHFLKEGYTGNGAEAKAAVLINLPLKGKNIFVRAAGEAMEYDYLEEYPDMLPHIDLEKILTLEYSETGFKLK